MKRIISAILIGLGCCSVAMAKPQEIYQNLGPNTNTPQIDAIIFYNQSTFNTDTEFTVSNSNPNLNAAISAIPYSTLDTVYYTNTSSGTIEGTPGFEFDTVTSNSRHSAGTLYNQGSITALDIPALPELFSTPGGGAFIADVNDSQPLASQIEVFCTNIINANGIMSVGNAGLLQLVGSNVNLANGDLIAGAVNTGEGFNSDPLDTTGDNDLFYVGFNFFVNPPSVYDLFWGVTNGGTLDLSQFNPPDTTAVKVGSRAGINVTGLSLPFNFGAGFASYVNSYSLDASNTYFNIVFVNTNFTDVSGNPNTNITASVGYTYNYTILDSQVGDLHAKMAMVQFSLPVYDVITGQIVTNSVYLMDAGGALSPMVDYLNAGSANGYSRPNAFVVTTVTPDAWIDADTSNYVYSPNLIYQGGTYVNKTVPYEAAMYGAQIGRDPAQVDGSFNFATSFSFFDTNEVVSNFFLFTGGVGGGITLPDPTNEPARLEITANKLNLSNSRLRAEGMVVMNASNIVGGASGYDWGEINATIGASNGFLVISNVFPSNYSRLRGDIYAWSGTWVNIDTNVSPTNTYHYHVLVVDQNLGGNFQSAQRNLNLTGSNAITVYDPLYVNNQYSFTTTNLILNSNTVFTQNAGNFTSANTPKLKYFLNNTNASMSIDGLIDIGYSQSTLPGLPDKRKYTVLGVTNFGTITATSPLFSAASFEDDGGIVANNNGSIVVDAATLGVGLVLTNSTNYLFADENITLSAISMGIFDSTFIAGGGTNGRGTLELQSSPSGEITDFASGDPSTNATLVNFWEVTAGFSLPIKPATGDLFGTEIETITTGTTVALHTWAGVDLGATSAGFADNMVIGHLKLSRQSSNSVMHFTGAGTQNGMYVDYLEFDDSSNSLSYTDYRDGLVIDPNLTIYFAACNADPIKLETVYSNRLVWVPSFAGPNSTVAVPILGSTNVCLMNTNLAFSHEVGFFTNTPNADNQPYVLNDPSNPTNLYPCPGETTTFRDFALLTGGTNVLNVQISTSGKGSITPNLKQSQIVMGKQYELMATAEKGWVFSGWSATGLPAGTELTSTLLKFKLENDVVLTAVFKPLPFTLVHGNYFGLFTNNAASVENSGAFTFSLEENGALSGRLLMGPAIYSFNSKFPTNGTALVTAKDGKQTLTVSLALNLSDPTGMVTGEVTGTGWSSSLLGYIAPTGWTGKSPSPYTGRYTFILTNTGSNLAIGDSFGSAAVSKPGVLTVGGRLADGELFSESVPISASGLWPFYVYVPHGEDFLLGWVDLQANGLSGGSIGETNILWSKGAASKDGFYPDGFSDMFNLIGSGYAFPGLNSTGLSLENPTVVLSGGGLAEALTNPVASNGKLTYSATNVNLSINPLLGSFSGDLKDSKGSPATSLKGVILQNQEGAFGFFLGTNHESGTVKLKGQ